MRNAHVKTEQPFTHGELDKVSELMNKYLSGLTHNHLQETYGLLINGNEKYADIIKDVLNALIGAMDYGEDANVYTSGMNNILSFPEFNDLTKARTIFEALEERDNLLSLLGSRAVPNKTRPQLMEITIGEENTHENMKECSVIKVNYRINNLTGHIGIVGPTRMDYARAMSILHGAAEKINAALGRDKEDM